VQFNLHNLIFVQLHFFCMIKANLLRMKFDQSFKKIKKCKVFFFRVFRIFPQLLMICLMKVARHVDEKMEEEELSIDYFLLICSYTQHKQNNMTTHVLIYTLSNKTYFRLYLLHCSRIVLVNVTVKINRKTETNIKTNTDINRYLSMCVRTR